MVIIKLKSLILEILLKESNNYIIVGTLRYDGDVESTIANNSNINHTGLGYGGKGNNWRYNPSQRIVYWWEEDDIDNNMKQQVEKHLLKKYNLTVDKHMPMVLQSLIDIGAAANDPNNDYDETDQYYHYMSSHMGE